MNTHNPNENNIYQCTTQLNYIALFPQPQTMAYEIEHNKMIPISLTRKKNYTKTPPTNQPNND